MISVHNIPQRKREDAERLFERKKVQLDDTKKISAKNNHETAIDTNEIEAEIAVCSL